MRIRALLSLLGIFCVSLAAKLRIQPNLRQLRKTPRQSIMRRESRAKRPGNPTTSNCSHFA
jgi:hypothetical protein